MPLHLDDPEREGNLSDEAYEAALAERMATGALHEIPERYLQAALAALAQAPREDLPERAGALPGSPITYEAASWLTNYGPFYSGRPWGRVLHSLECDPVPGICRELSAPGGYLDGEGLAPHGMSDPTQRVRACSTRNYSGHVGPLANPHVVGYEVAGRAANSRAQWLDGGNQQAALESDAKLIAWDCVQDGWARSEIRMLSGAQIIANYNGSARVRGFLPHNDVSQFIGGTNHWDPGPGFPFDWFLDRVRAYYDLFKGGTVDPVIEPEDPDMARAIIADGRVYLYALGMFRDIGTPVQAAGQLNEGTAYKSLASAKPEPVSRERAAQIRTWALRPSTPLAPPQPVTTVKYTVRAGDTFTSIATAHGISVDALKRLNPQVTNIENIIAGETVLNVPKV